MTEHKCICTPEIAEQCPFWGIPMKGLNYDRCSAKACSEKDQRHVELWYRIGGPAGNPAKMQAQIAESLEEQATGAVRPACQHLGAPTGDMEGCPTCKGVVKLRLFRCGHPAHPEPITLKFCKECPDYVPRKAPMKWAYGVTTVPMRRRTTLPKTLASLQAAGFDKPWLFVDGDQNADLWAKEFGLEVTTRHPNIRVFGNWFLSAHELMIREPHADRYAVFQDDFVTYPNLRKYLESCEYPEAGYWNLYTFPANQTLAPKSEGWFLSNQRGLGAVALVFNRKVLEAILTTQHMIERPKDTARGWRNVDGGIVTGANKAGVKEYVHHPSLVQHIGDVSAMANRQHPKAESFRGEDFDAMTLAGKSVNGERQRIERALADDEERLKNATTESDRTKYTQWIATYRDRLAKLC